MIPRLARPSGDVADGTFAPVKFRVVGQNRVTSYDLGILVDQSAETITADYSRGARIGHRRALYLPKTASVQLKRHVSTRGAFCRLGLVGYTVGLEAAFPLGGRFPARWATTRPRKRSHNEGVYSE